MVPMSHPICIPFKVLSYILGKLRKPDDILRNGLGPSETLEGG